jgi:hypothetical protein
MEQQLEQLEQQKLEQELQQEQKSEQEQQVKQEGESGEGESGEGEGHAEERAKYWRQIASLRVELHKEQKRVVNAETKAGNAAAAEAAAATRASAAREEAAELRKLVQMKGRGEDSVKRIKRMEAEEGKEGEEGESLRKQLRRARTQLKQAMRKEQQRQEEDVRRATEAAIASSARITRAVKGPAAVVTDILRGDAQEVAADVEEEGGTGEGSVQGSARYQSMVEELRRLRKRERQLQQRTAVTEASAEELQAGVEEGRRKLQRWKKRQLESEAKRRRGDAAHTLGVSCASIALGVLLCLLYFVMFGGGGMGRSLLGM